MAPASDKKIRGVLLLLTLLLVLIFYQNLPPDIFSKIIAGPAIGDAASAANGPSGNTVDRTIRILMLAVSAIVIATRWSVAMPVLKRLNPGFSALVLLIPLSAMWSIDRTATLLRFVTFFCIVLVCFSISITGWDRSRVQKVVIVPVMLILTASLILGIMFPEGVKEEGTGISLENAWHGITPTKNSFGMMASAGLIICLHSWLTVPGKKLWFIVGAAVSFICVVLSRSSTSLFAGVVGVFYLFAAFKVPVVRNRLGTQVAIGIAAVLLIYEMVIMDVLPGVHTLLGPIAEMVGKDTSFSSRTGIWDLIKEKIHGAPLLGTGYGAYWTGPYPSSPSYVFVYRMYFYPTESHNGYLEIVSDLGYAGLVCLALFLFWFMKQCLQLMKLDREQAVLYLALLYHQMVVNMSESDWFTRSSIFTMLVLSTFCLARTLHEHRRRAGAVLAR